MESYPPTPVTTYGVTLLKEGIEPHITYISPDGEIAFYLNGGLAPWPGVTEGIVLNDGPEGLHPTFSHLDHRGARQAGSTWVDTVYDPAEITLNITATGRSPEGLRKVIRKWIASWDPKTRGTLSWVTPDGGEWWCHPRLFRPPPEKLSRTMARSKEQKFTWSIRNDDAFWRSHDSVGTFNMAFNTGSDSFSRDDSGTLGTFWSQIYSGAGAGVCETANGYAKWTPSGTAERTVQNRWLGIDEIQTVTVSGAPTTWCLTFNAQTTADIAHPASAGTVQTALEGLSNIGVGDVSVSGSSGGPYTITFIGALAKTNVSTLVGAVVDGGTNPVVRVGKTREGAGASTGSDNQVVTIKMGSFVEWPWPTGARFDIWARMSADGQNGIRLRIAPQSLTLSRFNGGVETVMHERLLILTPLWNEQWVLQCGTATNSRQFQVKRNGFTISNFKEVGTGSLLGASYRGVGFGMKAGADPDGQDVPPTLFQFDMGDNATITQSGHLSLTNFGDQERYPDLVVYGPGTFFFGDGPGTPPTIEFGPLADGQVALIKTNPGERGVYDLTADHTEQDLPFFQSFLKSLISFAFNNNIPPLLNWFQSIFGIDPPQGNLYALLKGRWTRAVPPRSLESLPTTSEIAVQIKDGNADSSVVAALTPLRRWPE